MDSGKWNTLRVPKLEQSETRRGWSQVGFPTYVNGTMVAEKICALEIFWSLGENERPEVEGFMKLFVVGFLLMTSVAWAGDSVRVFLGDHENWQQASSMVQTATTGAGRAEQTKTLMKACPAVTITADRDKADFLVQWDSKTWQQTSWGGHENEFTVYNSAKDVVGTGSAHHMKNAASDICKMITSQKK